MSLYSETSFQLRAIQNLLKAASVTEKYQFRILLRDPTDRQTRQDKTIQDRQTDRQTDRDDCVM